MITTRERQRRRAYTCSACWKQGHSRRACTEPLFVWTNGPDMMIATSAERCARIFNDPLGPDFYEDLYSKPADWTRVETDPLELRGEGGKVVSRLLKDWIWLLREGFLAVDGGELVPPRNP